MMNFDLTNSSLGNAVSTSTQLAPNKIHEVTFKGLEYAVSKNNKWEFMRMKFQGINEPGFFTDVTFWDEGKKPFERQAGKFGENASEFETLQLKLKHLIIAVAPELLEKMASGEIKFALKGKTEIFKQYITFMSKELEEYIDRTTQIKLVANNKGEASFPSYFTIIKEDGRPDLKNNFIGKNLGFSAKEKERMTVQATARPTIMPELNTDLSLDDAPSTENAESNDLMDLKF